jgi:hypothetical protein
MSNQVTQATPVPRSFYSLVQFQHPELKRSSQVLKSRESSLCEDNPVAAMDDSKFRELLRLALGCSALLEGHVHKKKTTIELAAWLRVMEGGMTVVDFRNRYGERLYSWTDLAQLQIEPLLACCYMRMVQDSTA